MLRTTIKTMAMCAALALVYTCSEDDPGFPRLTSLKVVNLINGVPRAVAKIDGVPSSFATAPEGYKIAFETSKNLAFQKATDKEVTIVKETDTLNPIYQQNLNLTGIHSLYLSGEEGMEDAVLFEDKVKQRFTDSLVAVRFINLSRSAGPVDVNIMDSTEASATGLAFQANSDYIAFPAKAADGSYTFEFRDQNGKLLEKATLNPLQEDNISVKKNLSLVLTEAGESPFGGILYRVARVNSYHGKEE